jgi:hypothetical protein
MSETTPVSFTVRRPSPPSRSSSTASEEPTFKVPALPRHLSSTGPANSPLSRSAASSPGPRGQSRTFDERDSSDDEDEATDELVTGFDQFGVQRCVIIFSGDSAGTTVSELTVARHDGRLHEKKKPEGPLVIKALKNKDWREVARKRRTSERYVPGSAGAGTGADGTVGGLGTRDSINSGPQLIGLQVGPKRVKLEHDDAPEMDVDTPLSAANGPDSKKEPEDEDKRALRALLAGDDENMDPAAIQTIPMQLISEAEALKQDVAELPESATLADYDRVPVSQFGAAMLRGMGWTGDDKGKGGKKNIQPWIPEQRPALLGIGAKEREVLDDGDPKKKKSGGKPNMKYMPLLMKEKQGSSHGSDAEGLSADSRQPRSTRERDSRSRADRERDYDSRDRSRRSDKDYERARDYDSRDRHRDERRDRDRDSDGRRQDERRRDERRDRDRTYESDREYNGLRDGRGRDNDKRRDYRSRDDHAQGGRDGDDTRRRSQSERR